MKTITSNDEKSTGKQKCNCYINLTIKILVLLAFFYFFIIALDFLKYGTQLIVGRMFSRVYNLGYVLDNKVAALMVGILMSVFFQSPTSSSAIVSAMVSSEAISVRTGIPMVMGINVGSTITSTLVAFSQANDNHKFEKAFSDAVLHDIFNLLSVLVLLPIEFLTHYLELVSGLLVGPLVGLARYGLTLDMMTVITKPFTHLILIFDKRVLDAIARVGPNKYILSSYGNYSSDVIAKLPLLKRNCGQRYAEKDCLYLMRLFTDFLPEWLIGLMVIALGLVFVAVCVVGLKRVLSSVFTSESMLESTYKFLNSDLPGPFKYLTGLLFILIGMSLTILIQSSSVFTSMLTLLVGVGILSIERVFPIILGSNIGITLDILIDALGGPRQGLRLSLQIALSHFIFNITGTLIWYPIVYMRKIPIKLAKSVGSKSGKYRWFSIIYVLTFFFILPSLILALAFAGRIVFICIFTLVCLIVIIVIVINILQRYKPNVLPTQLRSWQCLPRCLVSLEPYDNMFKSCHRIRFCCAGDDEDEDDNDLFIYDPTSAATQNLLLLDNSKLYNLNKIDQNASFSF